jgi:hypothetical protein
MTLLARLMRVGVGRVRCLGNKQDRERETKQLTDVGEGVPTQQQEIFHSSIGFTSPTEVTVGAITAGETLGFREQ